MKKICEKCGKEFEANQPHFKFCPDCFSKSQFEILPSEFLLNSYFDKEGNFLKEVYIDLPQKIANIFFKNKLAIKQLRDVHRKILKAKTKAMIKGIQFARNILYECQRDLEYQLKRNIVPECFVKFMKHHLIIAEKDEKSLEGFFQHLDSIVCYFPIKK